MVNFDGQAESLASQYAALDHIVDPYDLENYQTVEQTDWGVCDWDWKIMVDNFMECYHHMGPHRGSLEDRFPAALSYTGEVGDYFTTMWSQQKQRLSRRSPVPHPRRRHPDRPSTATSR